MNINEYLFDSSLLEELDFSETGVLLKHNISSNEPGENLRMRSLCKSDFQKGYMDVLSQLTDVGDISEEMFIQRFDEMKSCDNSYFVVVIEDLSMHTIIASGTLTLEQQLSSRLHIKTRGRIEDIVVSNTHRGKYLGKLMLDTLILLAQNIGCDDLSLECKDPLVRFYKQFGFQVKNMEVYMGNRYLH